MDPLLDTLRLLGPRATLFGGGLDAAGAWALSFRQRNDLLFCWVEQGECQLLRPDCAAVRLAQGDFALIHTSTPFTLASDEAADAIDSETAVAAAHNARLTLGSGTDRRVTLHAGKFVVQQANAQLLGGLFPPLVHIASSDASLSRVRALLTMNEMEAREPGPASEFIIVRLVELILVEILRTSHLRVDTVFTGLLAGLADPVTRLALTTMHRAVAHAWTVDELAKLCAVSRSSFAARFRAIVGTAPIAYLLNWRMALAREELSRGTKSVGEIAFAIGFQSASAFTTAFTHAVGRSPTRYAQEARQ
jgi:AraC-like DNA-binding protein